MALSEDEMHRIKVEALGGLRASVSWNDALNALHTYAHKSACPAGHDVVSWFSERSDAYRASTLEAIRKSNEEQSISPSAGLDEQSSLIEHKRRSF